ncbi:MAG: PKD domain-containing protein, partial [Thermoplasmata archaeon]|nr:PKD domain-containing protein [Thermoplasmata archaeon]
FIPSFNSVFEIRYVDPTGSSHVSYSTSVWTLGNSNPTVNVPRWTEGNEGEAMEFMAQVHDEDGTIERVIVDWEDGTNDTLVMPSKGILTFSHVYGSAGNYDVSVMVEDNDGEWTNVTTVFIVTDEGALEGTFGNAVIAIALIIFVALLGVLVGHLSGYYRIGREREGKEETEEPSVEPEEEPEQTAEEIISELEEDLGDEEDREYFDHEPSVAELEEMIPKDKE